MRDAPRGDGGVPWASNDQDGYVLGGDSRGGNPIRVAEVRAAGNGGPSQDRPFGRAMSACSRDRPTRSLDSAGSRRSIDRSNRAPERIGLLEH